MKRIENVRRYSRRDTLNHPRNVNHTLHMVLTFCTLGLWLPVWTVLALRREGWKHNHLWAASGKGIKGMTRINRMELTPEARRSL